MAIGSSALYFNTTGRDNVAIGNNSLNNNTGGNYNIGIGKYALRSSTTGSSNVALGSFAMEYNTTGFYNNAMGPYALWLNYAGANNNAFGYYALGSNQGGSGNNALGNSALTSNTTGSDNNAFGSGALGGNTTGYQNNSFGKFSLSANTTGHDNNALGYSALGSNTSGIYNNAFGPYALGSNTTGVSNNAFGFNALFKNSTGGNNTAIGSNAMGYNTTGSDNLALGFYALNSNIGGSNNAALGNFALAANTTGIDNTAIGFNSLRSNINGYSNIAVGKSAMFSNTGGARNVALGEYALYSNTTGSFNNAFGTNALFSNTTGINNNATGFYSLQANTIGANNNAFGYYSLLNNISGNDNNSFGYFSMRSNTTGVNNNALGNSALYANTTGSDNNALGYQSLYSNTTGTLNNAFGNKALYANTTGYSNNAFGPQTLTSNISGANNNSLGYFTLFSNISGSRNNAMGSFSLYNNTTGSDNNAIGDSVLSANTTGYNNNAFGPNALNANTTGSNNSALGSNALSYNNIGSDNSAVGRASLYNNKTGNNNNAMGQYALGSLVNGSSNVAVGDNSLYNVRGSSNVGLGSMTGFAVSNYLTGDSNTFIGTGATVVDDPNSAASGLITLLGAGTRASVPIANTSAYMTAIGAGSSVTTINTVVLGRTTDKTVIGATGDNLSGNTLQVTGGFQTITGNITNTAGKFLAANGNGAAPTYSFINNTNTGFFNPGANQLGASVGGFRSFLVDVGSGNVSLGKYANTNDFGAANTAIGHTSMFFNSSGTSNTAVGVSSLFSSISGSHNTAVGSSAVGYSASASYNTGVGDSALNNADADGNTGIGSSALYSTTTGIGNSATGFQSLYKNTTGAYNVGIGYNVGFANSTSANTSSYITLLGADAFANPGSAGVAYMTAVGAGSSVSTFNTVVLGRTTDKTVIGATGTTGSAALLQISGASQHVGIPTGSAPAGSAGMLYYDSTLGRFQFNNGATWQDMYAGVTATPGPVALSNLTAAASANTISNGAFAQSWGWQMTANTTAYAIGESVASTGGTGTQYLMSIGTLAGSTASPLVVSSGGVETFRVSSGSPQILANLGTAAAPTYSFAGNASTGLYMPASGEIAASIGGSRALWLKSNNTAVGYSALAANTIGISNTAFGANALAVSTNGVGNTAVGQNALTNTAAAQYNIAVGLDSLVTNVVGSRNVAVGVKALQSSTANYNTAIGYNGLFANTTGIGNVAAGYFALSGNTTGSYNMAIGYMAGNTNNANANASSAITLLGFNTAATPGAINANAYMTAVGSGSSVSTFNTVVLGRTTDKTVIGATGDSGAAALLQVNGASQHVGLPTASAPVGSAGMLYYDSTLGRFQFYNGAGWKDLTFGTASSPASLSSLTAATVANTINNGAFAQSWKWQMAANTTALALGENVASTGGTGAQYLMSIGTLAGSTASPFVVSSRGVEAFRVSSTTPQILANGGTEAAPAYSFVGDAGTGLYAPAANMVGLSIAGSRSLVVDNTNNNIGLGIYSLASTTGTSNIGMGYKALYAQTTGSSNVAIGDNALSLGNNTGNVAVGVGALLYTDVGGDYNVAVGFATGTVTGAANPYTGTNSTFVGANARVDDSIPATANSGYITLLGAGTRATLFSASPTAYMTAVGAGVYVDSQNTVVLGRPTDKVVIGDSRISASPSSLQVTGGIHAVTGQILGGLGTVAAPTYSFAGNLGTGLYLPSTTQIALSVGGAQKLLVGPSTFAVNGSGVSTGTNDVVLGGTLAGSAAGSSNVTLLGAGSTATLGAINASAFMTAVGAGASVTTINTVVLGRAADSVAIGQTLAGAYKLTVNGTAGGTSAYAVSSDRRFKQHIEALAHPLDIIKQLQGVSYEFNHGAFPERKFETGRQIGFIAQQIEGFVPEVVRTDKDGYKSVQYSQLVPLIVEGIKEQQNVLQHILKMDKDTLSVNIKTFQAQNVIVSNFTADTIKVAAFEADTARIKKLEADSIDAKSVRSDVVKTGEKSVFVAEGMFQPVFSPGDNTQYLVNAVADDGSMAFASVAVVDGKVMVKPVNGTGLDIVSIGKQVGVVAASKKVKTTWIRMS